MGWWTEITIIVEQIENKEIAVNIAELVYDKEIKYWESKHISFLVPEDGSFSLYHSYDRRNYAPISVLTEISKQNPRCHFTILASTLEFVCGPAGIIRLLNGQIQDAYGIYDDTPNRFSILEKPIENRFIIYDLYKFNGVDYKSRRKLISKFPEFPKGINNDFFLNRILPIKDIDNLELTTEDHKKTKLNWIELPKFKVEDYMNPEVVDFVLNNSILKEIEQEIQEILGCSFVAFNYHTFRKIKKLLPSEFDSIKQIEQELILNKSRITDWILDKMSDKDSENIKFQKGAPVAWLLKSQNEIN